MNNDGFYFILFSWIVCTQHSGMKYVCFFCLGQVLGISFWLSERTPLIADRRDVLPVVIGGPKTKNQPRMAELVLSQKRCISGRGAFCRPACPGAGGHLWRGNHGHICGLSPVQDGVEGHCPFGAGQVRIPWAWIPSCPLLLLLVMLSHHQLISVARSMRRITGGNPVLGFVCWCLKLMFPGFGELAESSKLSL